MKNPFIAIDPGTRSLGWALFDDHLIGAGVVRAQGLDDMLKRLRDFAPPLITGDRDVVIEIPQIYRASKSKGDPNDLIPVAIVAGAVGVMLRGPTASVRMFTPHVWKGSVPKPIVHSRVFAVLNDQELENLAFARDRTPKGSQLDLLDAVSIGIWHQGRMSPRR